MIFLYLFFVIIFLIGIRFTKKSFNENYLSKETITIINGMFVITIFFSHFKGYLTTTNTYDNYLIWFLDIIGQLMVTSFLFYSGYGIYESIKNKKDYMKTFFKKRFIPTFFNFAIAIIIFLVLNLIMGNNYSIEKILLSFTGYYSIGNSNWYMLAIFVLYLLTIICFSSLFKIKNIYRLFLLTFFTIIYIFIISKFKDFYYADTILCYPIGMLYSYFKEVIDKRVCQKYYFYFIFVIILFLGSFYLKKIIPNICIYNINAIFFILLVVLLSMKFKMKNRIFTFLGIHTFWIYILQRIPMMILNINNNYLYFFSSLFLTIIVSYIIKKITDKLWINIYKMEGKK